MPGMADSIVACADVCVCLCACRAERNKASNRVSYLSPKRLKGKKPGKAKVWWHMQEGDPSEANFPLNLSLQWSKFQLQNLEILALSVSVS